jgi:hypothetical protein
VQTTVGITVKDDGSGTVRVGVVADAEAVKAVEVGAGKLETAVRFAGLDAAGWKVGAWQRHPDGSATVELTHPFENVSEVHGIIASANGQQGPVRDVAVSRERGLLATRYSFDGRGHLFDVGTGISSDSELVKRLTAQGVDPKVIDQQLLAQLKASFTLRVVVRLPGAKTSTITLKSDAFTRLHASSSVLDTQRVLLLGAALGLLLLALVVWVRGSRSGRARRRGPTPARSGSDRAGSRAPAHPRSSPIRRPPPPRRPPTPNR